MDSASRRVAALQREADGLIAQAAKLQKDDPRLKELASRLQVIESEYSALLSAKPQAVAGHDELTALRSENVELRRRNNELEQQIATLLRWQQDSQKELTRLESELRMWQDSLNAKERTLEPRLAAAEELIQSAMSSKCDDMQRFDSASQQLKEMHSRVDEGRDGSWQPKVYSGTFSHELFGPDNLSISVEMTTKSQGSWTARGQTEAVQITWDGKKVRMKSSMTELSGEIVDGVLKGSVIHNGSAGGVFQLTAETQANWDIDLRAITDHIGEAKQLMSTAKAEVETQSQSALRAWASSELERLKKQLAATSTQR